MSRISLSVVTLFVLLVTCGFIGVWGGQNTTDTPTVTPSVTPTEPIQNITKSFENNTYILFDEELTIQDAIKSCENNKGYLVTITSMEQFTFITTNMFDSKATPKYIWISGHQNAFDKDPNWVYSNGRLGNTYPLYSVFRDQTYQFSKFNESEPALKGKQCLALYKQELTNIWLYLSRECEKKSIYICQIDDENINNIFHPIQPTAANQNPSFNITLVDPETTKTINVTSVHITTYQNINPPLNVSCELNYTGATTIQCLGLPPLSQIEYRVNITYLVQTDPTPAPTTPPPTPPTNNSSSGNLSETNTITDSDSNSTDTSGSNEYKVESLVIKYRLIPPYPTSAIPTYKKGELVTITGESFGDSLNFVSVAVSPSKIQCAQLKYLELQSTPMVSNIITCVLTDDIDPIQPFLPITIEAAKQTISHYRVPLYNKNNGMFYSTWHSNITMNDAMYLTTKFKVMGLGGRLGVVDSQNTLTFLQRAFVSSNPTRSLQLWQGVDSTFKYIYGPMIGQNVTIPAVNQLPQGTLNESTSISLILGSDIMKADDVLTTQADIFIQFGGESPVIQTTDPINIDTNGGITDISVSSMTVFSSLSGQFTVNHTGTPTTARAVTGGTLGSIQVLVPQGTGVNNSIAILVDGILSSNAVPVIYNKPTIIALTPIPHIDGNVMVTIQGSNFGTDSKLVQVTFTSGPGTNKTTLGCQDLSVKNHNSLYCRAPVGVLNVNYTVSVTVNGQESAVGLLVSYRDVAPIVPSKAHDFEEDSPYSYFFTYIIYIVGIVGFGYVLYRFFKKRQTNKSVGGHKYINLNEMRD